MSKHKVVHFEIPASDFKTAKDFYGKVFGWKTEPWQDKYMMANTVEMDKDMKPTEAGGINGGFYLRRLKSEQPSFVIETDSIDETLKNVKKNGGKVTRNKEKISDEIGYMAEFVDPDGNEMSLFESSGMVQM